MLLGNYFDGIHKNYKKLFFSGISFNTRLLKKNNIFFAIKGNSIDGNKFISKAIEKGSKIIVVEGTVYPLLSRLKKSDYIKHEWKESTQGPPRKYYSISVYGLEHLKELIVSWSDINSSVKELLKTKK